MRWGSYPFGKFSTTPFVTVEVDEQALHVRTATGFGPPDIDLPWVDVVKVERVRGLIPIPGSAGLRFTGARKPFIIWAGTAVEPLLADDVRRFAPGRLVETDSPRRLLG